MTTRPVSKSEASMKQKIFIHENELPTTPAIRVELDETRSETFKTNKTPSHQVKSHRYILMALTILVLLLFGFFVSDWYLRTPNEQWIERLGTAIDRSVLRLETNGSMGTGFIVASYGNEHLVLTNRHVVGESHDVRAVLRSNKSVQATVVGFPSDKSVDLALLRITASGLRPLGPIGTFSSVRPGAEVVAVGHPLGFDYTITDGIVSAKREGLLLQTTAAISPGNSGGPLIRRDGAVVGVNTMIVNRAIFGQSLCFAIRADYLLEDSNWQFSNNCTELLNQIR